MIEVHSVIVVLVLEALAALLLALVVLSLRSWLKQRRDRVQMNQFVEHINQQDEITLQQPAQPSTEASEELLAGEMLQQTLEAVSQREKALYRHVLQAFLRRDASKLTDLDHYVRALSEPYTALIQELLARPPKETSAQLTERVQQAQADAQKAREEAEHIKQKLGSALNTLNNVSSEYAKMFHMPDDPDPLAAGRPAQPSNVEAPWMIPPSDAHGEENT